MDTPAGMEGQKADAPTKPDAVTIVDYATALAASTRSWTSEEVTDTYKRMVGPLVSYLEPPVTENQVQQILQNMKDGEGSKWLAFQALRDKYERRLSEADYKQMVWDESVAYNAMSAYIKRYILSAEQARWFPYGRRYHEQK